VNIDGAKGETFENHAPARPRILLDCYAAISGQHNRKLQSPRKPDCEDEHADGKIDHFCAIGPCSRKMLNTNSFYGTSADSGDVNGSFRRDVNTVGAKQSWYLHNA
jgi:hypothetical protein